MEPGGSPSLAIVKCAVPVANLDQPIYIGQAVLDINKRLMAEFHYQVWRPLFNERSRLLWTDTDSLAYR